MLVEETVRRDALRLVELLTERGAKAGQVAELPIGELSREGPLDPGLAHQAAAIRWAGPDITAQPGETLISDEVIIEGEVNESALDRLAQG